MFFGSAVVAATNLLVLRELHELRNLPRLPIKIQFYLVLNMVTLKENIDSFVIVMFQDQRDTDWRPGPPDTTTEKFENETFTQETHQMFPFTLRRRNLKKTSVTITGHFGFVFEENSGREIKWQSWLHRFRKVNFHVFYPHSENKKPAFPNFHFSWRIRVDGRPTRKKKAAFSDFSRVVRTGPE